MNLTKKDVDCLAQDLTHYLTERGAIKGTTITTDGNFDSPFKNACLLKLHIENSSLAEILNYEVDIELADRMFEDMEKIFKKYGVRYSMTNRHCLSVYPADPKPNTGSYPSFYSTETDGYRINSLADRSVPAELRRISAIWKKRQNDSADTGPCVLGAGMHFRYKNKPYVMPPLGRSQGSLSWETSLTEIGHLLTDTGCTAIYYDPGIID